MFIFLCREVMRTFMYGWGSTMYLRHTYPHTTSPLSLPLQQLGPDDLSSNGDQGSPVGKWNTYFTNWTFIGKRWNLVPHLPQPTMFKFQMSTYPRLHTLDV